MHEGPALLLADPLGGRESRRHVGHHDELGPIVARLLDPGGIGAGQHHHLACAPSSRAAQAVAMAWLPALTAVTPRASCSGARPSIRPVPRGP